ncbi:hypothetical protein ARMGADRAFT_222214 [Armillaria gallica]|uniref:Cytochrome P450 n=1 Tax=Armillaria gallica TaxID=47427 RepID=A0A2H3EF35_ARMGA|nr:hypothetical protein ARMGADRAFT_222214 [Armillaria gallica]
MALVFQVSTTNICVLLAFTYLLYKIVSHDRQNGITTQLRGPTEDQALLTERWASEYGPVFYFPSLLGEQRLVLSDPKAVAHFYGKAGSGYTRTPIGRMFIEILFGKNLLWTEGKVHRRQCKHLTSAFSNAAIWDLTYVFYDSAHKAIKRQSHLASPHQGAPSMAL